MPYVRLPPDRLIHLPIFGIDVIKEDGEFVWMTGGPNGSRQAIWRHAPRVWFDDLNDAKQAGATAIMISEDDQLPSQNSIQPTDEQI